MIVAAYIIGTGFGFRVLLWEYALGITKILEARTWRTASSPECLVVEGWHNRFLKSEERCLGSSPL
jgi:hypothetical protein